MLLRCESLESPMSQLGQFQTHAAHHFMREFFGIRIVSLLCRKFFNDGR
jgi:hypothetical protein